MKTGRRILSVVLSLVILVGLFPISATAQAPATSASQPGSADSAAAGAAGDDSQAQPGGGGQAQAGEGDDDGTLPPDETGGGDGATTPGGKNGEDPDSEAGNKEGNGDEGLIEPNATQSFAMASPFAAAAGGGGEPAYAEETLFGPLLTTDGYVELRNGLIDQYLGYYHFINVGEAHRFIGLEDSVDVTLFHSKQDWVGMGDTIVEAGFVGDRHLSGESQKFPLSTYYAFVYEGVDPVAPGEGEEDEPSDEPVSTIRHSQATLLLTNLDALRSHPDFAYGTYFLYVVGSSGQQLVLDRPFYVSGGPTGPRTSYNWEGYYLTESWVETRYTGWPWWSEGWHQDEFGNMYPVFNASDTISVVVENYLPPLSPYSYNPEDGWIYGHMDVHLVPDAPADRPWYGMDGEYWDRRYYVGSSYIYYDEANGSLRIDEVYLDVVLMQNDLAPFETGKYRLELEYEAADGARVTALSAPFIVKALEYIEIVPFRTDYYVGDTMDYWDYEVLGHFTSPADEYLFDPMVLDYGDGYEFCDDIEYYFNYPFSEAGTYTVTVQGQGYYEGFEASFDVEVTDPPVDMAEVFPDEGLRAAVYDALGAGWGDDVFQSQLVAIAELDASNRGITDTTGLYALPSLEVLNLDGNNLDGFSLSGLTMIQKLYIRNAGLYTLDVGQDNIVALSLGQSRSSDAPALRELYCDGNMLEEIYNLSQATRLEALSCSGNQLTSLDLWNGEHITYLDCSSNSLTSLTLNYVNSAAYFNCADNRLKSLNMNYSLKSALRELDVSGNELTTLNLLGCNWLSSVYCNNNALTSINLSGCAGLQLLNASHNRLAALDTSACTQLRYLTLNDNELTALDLTANGGLVNLFADDNYLRNEDVIAGLSALELENFAFEPQKPSVPTTPGLPAAGLESTQSLRLVWDASTDRYGVDYYEIYRDGELAGTSVTAAYTDTGLRPATGYTYSVRAVNGRGTPSEMGPARALSTVDLTVRSTMMPDDEYTEGLVDAVEVRFALRRVSSLEYINAATASFQYRPAGGDDEWTSVPMDLLVYSDQFLYMGSWDMAALAPGMYDVQFIFTDLDGTVFVPGEKQVELKPEPAVPTAPGAPALVSHGTRSITLAWEESADRYGVTGYTVYRDGEPVGETEQPAYTDTGLEPGTAYTYTVVAENTRGAKSDPSEAAALRTAAITLGGYTDIGGSYYRETTVSYTAELAITGGGTYSLEGSAAFLQYRLQGAGEWTDLPMTLVEDYQYRYKFREALDIPAMSPGAYEMRFLVTDAEGTELATEIKELTINEDTTPPTVATNLTPGRVYGADAEVSVTVVGRDDVAVRSLSIAYSTDGGYTFVPFGSYESPVLWAWELSHSFPLDHSALPDGPVVIRAMAFDRAGFSATTLVEIGFDKTPPPVPSDATTEVTDEYIFVNWAYPDIPSDFRRFTVWRSESPDEGFAAVKTGVELGYYDDSTTGVLAGVTYYYYVTAEDTHGNHSAATATLSARLVEDEQPPVLHAYSPVAGSELRKSADIVVSATDNYKLSRLMVEYRPAGGEWAEAATAEAGDQVKSKIFRTTWDCSALSAGNYEVRYSVYDAAGNAPAVQVVNYTVKAYTAPVAPALSAEAGHKAVTLSWQYAGEPDLLYAYKLYRATSPDGSYTGLRTFGAGTLTYTDTVPNGVTYWYKIEAVDRYGATAQSEALAVAAVQNDDIPPVAAIGPDELVAAVGQPFTFSGAASTDNDAIAAYEWSFGDGSEGSGAMASHTYATAGEYTVSLTVTDDSGNTHTAQAVITVYDVAAGNTGYTLATFTVVDASVPETPAVGGATVLARTADGTREITAAAGADGVATVLLEDGSYTVSVTKNGYLPRTFQLEAAGGVIERTVGLSTASLVTGELTVTEMTIEEIIEAGIDTSDPDNQHVTKVEVEFEFTVNETTTITLPVAYYKNEAGTFIPSRGNSGYTGEPMGAGTLHTGEGPGGTSIAVYPISERFYLVVYGEAHWLKEMYNVELVVINNSYTDSISDVTATLALPEGLSLAAMVDGVQALDIALGDIATAGQDGSTAAANWYVRGDAEGEYLLSATVAGTNQPNGDPFSQTFTATQPLKVYAGSALELNITAEPVAYRGTPYTALFELKNTSDKALYNLSFAIKGADQFQVATVNGFSSGIVWSQEDFGDNMAASVGTLNPGDSIVIRFSTPVWFRSILDNGPVSAEYLLRNVFVTTLEGSTTEIPTNVTIGSASLAAVYELTGDTVETGINLIAHRAAHTAELEAGESRSYRIAGYQAGGVPSSATVRLENGTLGAGGVIELAADTTHYTVNDDGSITIAGDAVLTVTGGKGGTASMVITYNDGDTYTVDYTVTQAEPVTAAVTLALDGEALDGTLAVPVPAAGSTSLRFTPQVTDQFGNAMSLAVVWSHGSLPGGVSVEDGLVTVESTAADGSFTLTATEPESGLSATVTLTLGTLKVDWAEVDALFAEAAYTYGDTAGKPALPAGGTATAVDTHSGAFAWADGDAVPPAGDATITVRFTVDEGDALYGGAVFEKAYTVQVARREVELTVQPARRAYGEANPAFGAEITGGTLAAGDTLESLALTYACAATQASPAGVPVPVTAQAANANYAVTVLPGQLTIAPADYAYTVQAEWLLPAGSTLAALAAPAAGTGANTEAVAGTFGWYVDAAFSRPATDADIAGLAGGAALTLYWRFTAQDPNYTAQPKTGAASVAIQAQVKLVSIAVSRQPTKREYVTGDALNLAGMVVTATYSDGATKTVTGWTASPADGSKLDTAGAKTVTIRYTEGGVTVTDRFTVTVNSAGAVQKVVQAVVTKVVETVNKIVSWLKKLF